MLLTRFVSFSYSMHSVSVVHSQEELDKKPKKKRSLIGGKKKEEPMQIQFRFNPNTLRNRMQQNSGDSLEQDPELIEASEANVRSFEDQSPKYSLSTPTFSLTVHDGEEVCPIDIEGKY